MADLTDAFETTVKQSALIQSVDEAIIEAGRTIAVHLDDVLATGSGPEVTKALYLMPHLNNILKELLATPASRRAAGLTDKEISGGKLQSLQGHAARKRSA